MKRSYSYIVIGAGALGSAAAYRLAKAGARDVLVLEQFELGHGKGASEDHSRIIRHSYHSDVYTRMTHAMFESWAEVEEESGLKLVTTTGGLDLAVAGSPGEHELNNYRRTLAPAWHRTIWTRRRFASGGHSGKSRTMSSQCFRKTEASSTSVALVQYT